MGKGEGRELFYDEVDFAFEHPVETRFENSEVLELLAKASLLAIEGRDVNVDLLAVICESIIEKEEFEVLELLKEAIGEAE